MDERTTVPRRKRSLWEIAYDRRVTPKTQRKAAALPGPAFDVALFGMFLFLGLGYMLSSV